MTIGELKERIEELNLSDSVEILFYDPVLHEVYPIDATEPGVYDPSKDKLIWADRDLDHVGTPCLALFI